MSRQFAELTRRRFLGTAAGAGGTVLLALALPGFAGGQKAGPRAANSQVNAWLTIGADNSLRNRKVARGLVLALFAAVSAGVAFKIFDRWSARNDKSNRHA